MALAGHGPILLGERGEEHSRVAFPRCVVRPVAPGDLARACLGHGDVGCVLGAGGRSHVGSVEQAAVNAGAADRVSKERSGPADAAGDLRVGVGNAGDADRERTGVAGASSHRSSAIGHPWSAESGDASHAGAGVQHGLRGWA